MAQAVTVKVYGRFDRLSIYTPFTSKDFPDAKPKFKGNLIIDPNTPRGAQSLEKLEAGLKQIGLEAWKKWPQSFTSDTKRFCLVDGNTNTREVKNSKTGELEDVVREGYAGMKYLKASSTNAPTIKDADAVTDLKATDGRPYNGSYGWFVVNLKDTEKGGKGLFAYLEIVQFIKHGDPLGGGRVSAGDYLSNEAEDDEEEV